MSFEDRREAGRRLADEVARRDIDDPLVLGLPRGGVPVAFAVADRLEAQLDVVLVRKISPPDSPEYGIGAVGEDDVLLLDREKLGRLGMEESDLRGAIERERGELEARARRYRGASSGVPVRDRTCVLVDDGVATGVSASAAIRVLRSRGAGRIVFAVPVGAPASVDRLREEADEVICLLEPPSFTAVGTWYHDFTQTTDGEVVDLLGHAARAVVTEREEQLPAGRVSLPAEVVVPDEPAGLVVFAHGSGARSPRYRTIARRAHAGGLATVLLDLLTPREAQVRDHLLDVRLLADRLVAVLDWTAADDALAGLPIGLFGVGAGAAAALDVAAGAPRVGAVVSRGGRLDLVQGDLREVRQPTLLLVGTGDDRRAARTREAVGRLAGPHELTVVTASEDDVDEPGTIEEVAGAALDWFLRHL